jgi:hypothetical protein
LNQREGDGLEETAWALKIQFEIMHRLFKREAQEIENLSAEIAAATEIDSSKDAEREGRNQLKDSWKRRVTDLY